MAPRQVRSLIAVPLLLASMAALSPIAAQAGTGTETFVSVISARSDYVPGDQYRFFDPENASISLSGDASFITVRASGGSRGTDSFRFEFAAPWGEVLQVGEYERAMRAVFHEGDRPGMAIYGDGHGCNKVQGRFRVNEITTGSTGAVTSVWIVYEHYCDGVDVATIGEVRVNVPGDGGNAAIGPREVRFPPTDPGAAMAITPFVIRNAASTNVDIAASSLSGPSAAEFQVHTDECAGQTLEPGSMCRVFVRWTPGSPGDKSATLLVPEAGGPTHAVSLEGYVHSGRTRLVMTSDPGDWIGQGEMWSHTPSNSRFAVGGGHQSVGGGVIFGDESEWGLGFYAPPDDFLTPGTTYQATRPFEGTGAGMEISGNGRGCNTVTGAFRVDQLDVNMYGELERLSVSFEQYCDSYTAALRGTFEFRATGAEPTETTITSGPTGVVTTPDATFSFAASVESSTFECSLDASGFQPCASPHSYEELSEGSHRFRVRAQSPDGRIDFTPAERGWIVDAVGPEISVVRPTAGVYVHDQDVGETGPIVVVGSVTVQATATDAESGVPTVGFDVNGMPVNPSNITRQGDLFRFTFRPPSPGEHTVTVRATNGSGLPSVTTFSVYGVPTP